jgi:CelD/BcsL family acetyltransferase involved in cellulose biosynthesis
VNRPLTTVLRTSEVPARGAPARAAAGLAVDVLTSAEAFAELAPEWNRLHAEATLASVFNSWIWQFQWWQAYGGSQPLRLLVAREGERVAGILPLYLQRARVLGVPVRVARFVGTGGDTAPDDLGPIVARGEEAAAAPALARAALRLRGIDAWRFSDLDPGSPFPAALRAAAGELGRASAAGTAVRIALVELPATWEAFLHSLGRDRRWQLRRSRRRVAERHRARFFVWEDAARLDAAIDRLAQLHRLRWAQAGGKHAFRSGEYFQFHRGVMHALLARRSLRLYCLEIDDAIRAMLYCFRFRNRIYLMQSGFDPALARLGIGKVLLGYALQHAIEEGNEAWDFLRGEHRYKDELATSHRETTGLDVFAATPAALASRARRVWLPRLKARLLRRGPLER